MVEDYRNWFEDESIEIVDDDYSIEEAEDDWIYQEGNRDFVIEDWFYMRGYEDDIINMINKDCLVILNWIYSEYEGNSAFLSFQKVNTERKIFLMFMYFVCDEIVNKNRMNRN
jgi:hypothetical protein